MNLRELINKAPEFQGKNILVIGSPASGKSFVTGLLKSALPYHRIIHTDDYMEHGFEQSLYVMMEDIKATPWVSIIEGMLGYRLLRKGVELDCYYPDIVIELLVSTETIEGIYNTQRDPSKLKGVMSQIKACNTVYAKYLDMPNDHKPEWIIVENDSREETETASQEDTQWMNKILTNQ